MTNNNSPWPSRIKAADTLFTSWATRFKCDELWNYYEGNQWANTPKDYNPYTFNQVYSTISIKIASFLFDNPKFNITPTPGSSDYNLEFASQSAQLKQDTLNTIVRNPKCRFKKEVELAFQDSFFHFGVLEIGYEADWILNPQANRPYKKSDEDTQVPDNKDKVLEQPALLPSNERIYLKRIDPKRFRVANSSFTYLERQDWVGYFDYVSRNDLLVHKKLKYRDKIEKAGSVSFPQTSLGEGTGEEASEHLQDEDSVKVWHIWDMKAMRRRLFLDGEFCELWSAPFTRLPLFDLRWIFRRKGFYPVPPVYHWLSPQDEINEAREQKRSHRRRFTRKYIALEGMVDDDEIDKFTDGGDGTVIRARDKEAIVPIADARLNAENDQSFMIAKDEFNIISGTSAEARGYADRTTATQAKLIESRSSVRESYESKRVNEWLVESAREILMLLKDKMALGMWVKLGEDPGNFLEEVKDTAPVYKWISTQDLSDGFDHTIELDITSVSPGAQQEEMQKFVTFISLCNQFPQISLSPTLIVETAYRVGYRNMKVIREMQKMATLQMLGAIGGAHQNSIAQAQTAQATPNDMSQITNQLQNQVTG